MCAVLVSGFSSGFFFLVFFLVFFFWSFPGFFPGFCWKHKICIWLDSEKQAEALALIRCLYLYIRCTYVSPLLLFVFFRLSTAKSYGSGASEALKLFWGSWFFVRILLRGLLQITTLLHNIEPVDPRETQ